MLVELHLSYELFMTLNSYRYITSITDSSCLLRTNKVQGHIDRENGLSIISGEKGVDYSIKGPEVRSSLISMKYSMLDRRIVFQGIMNVKLALPC